MDNKPTLNQISHLAEFIQRDEALQKHFDLTDTWEKISILTLKQIKYIHFLILKGKRAKLNQLITDIGFKPKQ